MVKIQNTSSRKTILFLVLILFLITATGYGIDLPAKFSLRPPLLTGIREPQVSHVMAQGDRNSEVSYNFKLTKVGRSVKDALDDLQATNNLLNSFKSFSLFSLGTTRDIKRQEAYCEPTVKLLENGDVSICFDTPVRNIKVVVNSSNHEVQISIKIQWDILNRALPGETHLAFDNVSLRQCESPFLTWRLAMLVTDKVAKWLGGRFNFEDSFYEGSIENIVLSAAQPNTEIENPTIIMTIPRSEVSAPLHYAYSSEKPIYVILKNHSPVLGEISEVVPALWDEQGLHFLIPGIQRKAEIREIFSFNEEMPETWSLKFNPVIERKNLFIDRGINGKTELTISDSKIQQVVTGPMIRGSGVEYRTYWNNQGIDASYTEGISIGNLHISPGKTLFETFASFEWQNSFGRFKKSSFEKNVVLQLLGPHLVKTESMYKYQFGKTEDTVRTFVRAAWIAKKMGFSEINVNMCCPAYDLEKVNGGAQMLLNPDQSSAVIRGINEKVNMKVGAKILLLSRADDIKEPDAAKTVKFAEQLQQAGISRLVVQAQTASSYRTHPEVVKKIAEALSIPVTYNGFVLTVRAEDIEALGTRGRYCHSVEGLLKFFRGSNVDQVMVARVLLGSPWILKGESPSDIEILNVALQHADYMLSGYHGLGEAGLFQLKVGILYYIRYLSSDRRYELRDMISKAVSQKQIIELLQTVLRDFTLRAAPIPLAHKQYDL